MDKVKSAGNCRLLRAAETEEQPVAHLDDDRCAVVHEDRLDKLGNDERAKAATDDLDSSQSQDEGGAGRAPRPPPADGPPFNI